MRRISEYLIAQSNTATNRSRSIHSFTECPRQLLSWRLSQTVTLRQSGGNKILADITDKGNGSQNKHLSKKGTGQDSEVATDPYFRSLIPVGFCVFLDPEPESKICEKPLPESLFILGSRRNLRGC